MTTVATIMKKDDKDGIKGTFVISNLSLRPFKNASKGNFLTFDISDKTGKTAGKIWDNADKAFETFKDKTTVVSLEGEINTYQGKNQVIVSKMAETEEYDSANFLPVSPRDPEEMWKELVKIMDKHVTHPDCKALWKYMKEDKSFVEDLKECPGGKGNVHHAYLHGLLEHLLGVVKNCLAFGQNYDCSLSFLLMGGFLHDIGKLLSYDYDLVIDMSDIGRLHGHVPLGYNMILKTVDLIDIPPKNKFNLKMVLGHLVLSHHGDIEKGAVVKQMTKEAILLVLADAADAEVSHVASMTDPLEEGQWSSFDGLRGRMYFKMLSGREK